MGGNNPFQHRGRLADAQHFMRKFPRGALQAVGNHLAVAHQLPDHRRAEGDYHLVAALPECGSFLKGLVGIAQKLFGRKAREGSMVPPGADLAGAGTHLYAFLGTEGDGAVEPGDAVGDGNWVEQRAERIDAYIESGILHPGAHLIRKTAAEHGDFVRARYLYWKLSCFNFCGLFCHIAKIALFSYICPYSHPAYEKILPDPFVCPSYCILRP